jgi:hypothetical protein
MVPITGVEFDCACAGATKNKRQNAAREIPLIIVLFTFWALASNQLLALLGPDTAAAGEDPDRTIARIIALAERCLKFL